MKKKNLSEKEIDEMIISQANDENAWNDIQILKNRAKCGSREKFLKSLSKVLKVAPDEDDKIK